MRRIFFSNLILVIFLNLLVKPLAIFGIDAEVQNRIGAEEYGLYFSLLNFTYLFNILLDLGITNYNTKHVAQFPYLVSRYMGKIIPFRLLLFLIYTVLTLCIAFFLNYDFRQFGFLLILIFNQFLISVLLYVRSYFAGLQLFKVDILFSVLDKFLLLLIAGYLLYFSKTDFTLTHFIYTQLVCYIITVSFALFMLLYKVGFPKLKWASAFNWAILRESYPYAILIFLMMLYNRIDAVMIERILPEMQGKSETGIYAQAFRLLDAFVMFSMLFSNLLFPMFSKQIKQKVSVEPLLELVSRILLSGAITLALFSFFYSEQVLSLVYKQDILPSIPIFIVLMFSFFPMCIILVFGTLLTANGSVKIMNKFSWLALLLNIVLNFFFIQTWGALGAAYTTLLTQSLLAIVYVFYVKFSFQLSINYKLIGSWILFASLLFLINSYFHFSALIFGGLTMLFLVLVNISQLKNIRLLFSSTSES
jgi:O-antigen/teichoic acid export membrane protein